MSEHSQAEDIRAIIEAARKIVVIQADNPDADSVASSLALEHILEEQGKEVVLFCGVALPSYLMYLPGADRVVSDLPANFDAGIIVDTSSNTLLEQLDKKGTKGWLAAKSVIVLDHHTTKPSITFAEVIYNPAAVATGEVIYELAKELGWPLNKTAKDMLAIAILSDSMGLTTDATSARSIHIIAELVEGGVKLAEIENARRASMRREPELVHYKGTLLQRVEFHGRVATLTIPWEEIEKYSPLYNPPMLVIDDMRLSKVTDVAICFKLYTGEKITAKIRCNYGKGVAAELAEHFGGGGHPYASGFKITDGRPFESIKKECLDMAQSLLENLERERDNEAI